MRKSIFMVLILIVFTSITSASSALYGKYWNDDRNYPRIHEHMGVIWYLDKKSIVTLEKTEQEITFSENIITIYMEKNPPIVNTNTVWLKSDTANHDVAYIKFSQNDPWKKVELSNTEVYNLFERNIFLVGWEAMNGQSYTL